MCGIRADSTFDLLRIKHKASCLMIIQCPNCSTGFNLPDKHITSKGAKLRCSRCSHVFRVRRDDPEQDIEFFYKPEDEKANAELAASEQGDASPEQPDDGGGLGAEESLAIELGADFEALLSSASTPEERSPNSEDEPTTSRAAVSSEPATSSEPAPDNNVSTRTQIGLPGVSQDVASPDLSGYGFGSSTSSQESEDPFPLAGGSLKNLKSKIKIQVPKPGAPTPSLGGGLSGSSVTEEPPAEQAESPTAGIDLFGDELAPPELDGDDPFAGAFQEESLDPKSFAEDSTASAVADAQPQEAPILQPGQPSAPVSFDAPHPQSAAALPEPVAPAAAHDFGEPTMLQANSGGAFVDAGDLVDPSFGSQGASFDPQQGVVAQPAVAPQQPVAPQVTTPQRPSTPQPARSVAQVTAAPQPARSPSPAADFEDSWPTQADAIAAHRIGGGGAQKVANVFLIMLIVLVGFLGLVAALNKGMLDFKQFGSMIEVAFSDGTYTPREEWIPKAKPQPKAAMEAPLRTESVWAEIVPFGKKKKQQVLVVRGLLRNFDQQDYLDVELRGIVLDGKERIKAEKVVTLGALISNARIQESSALDDFGAMLPESAPPLKVASSEPFTIFFDDIPQDVLDGEPVFFRVDVAKKTGRDGMTTP